MYRGSLSKTILTIERINLRVRFLKCFLPEINYLQLIENLEIFEAKKRGLHVTKAVNYLVDLRLVRENLKELQKCHKNVLKNLNNLNNCATKKTKEILFQEFHSNLKQSKRHLKNSQERFLAEIELHKNFLYDLKILVGIETILDDINWQVTVLSKNLDNLKKSVSKTEIKDILPKIYTSAIISSQKEFSKAIKYFPKIFTRSLISMDDEVDVSEENESVVEGKCLSDECCIESENDAFSASYILECLERQECPDNAPELSELFQVDEVCNVSITSFDPLYGEGDFLNKFQVVIEQRKMDLLKASNNLLELSRQISRIDYEMNALKCKYQAFVECIEEQKFKYENSKDDSEEEKGRKLNNINSKLEQYTNIFEENKKVIEEKRALIKSSAREDKRLLDYHSKLFRRTYQSMINELELLKAKSSNPDAALQEKIEELQRTYENDRLNIENYKKKVSNLFDENEVNSSENTSPADTSSILSTSSLDKEKKFLQREIKNDTVGYLKEVLGKSLIEGLVEITLRQPADPIYFLANYLLNYRYNELRTAEKQTNFENLLLYRERIARERDKNADSCDPCKKSKQKPGID